MTSISDQRPLRGVALLFLLLVIVTLTYLSMTNWRMGDFDINFYPVPSSVLKSVFSWEISNETQVYTPFAKPAVQSTNLGSASESQGECLEGLDGMLDGYWTPKPMGPEDVKRMKTFLKHAREVEHHMPPGLQRSDKRCGNLTFEPKPELFVTWFRALCDAEGPTPCCFNNNCVEKSVEQCACPNCFDMRTELHAEYATWRTKDPSCQPLDFNKSELCSLLDEGTIYFIGDSLVRHVHTAMLMTIRDEDTGAFSDSMPKDIQEYCRGLNMFTEKVCRLHLAGDVRVCGGRVRLRWMMAAQNSEGAFLHRSIAELKNQPKTLVFVGIGFHGGFNSDATFHAIQPTLDQMANERWKWPVVLWASIHHFGVLRNPSVHGQPAQVKRFNDEMTQRLTPYFKTVPLHVFNAFNLTAAVSSFDGQHYGLGVNKVKVNILMNFIYSLRENLIW